MKNLLPLDDEYMALLRQIKSVIRSTQIKAALVVNQGLIELYWEIGKMIVREQETKGLGQRGGGAPGCRFENGVSGYGWIFPPTALFYAAIFYFLPRSRRKSLTSCKTNSLGEV